MTAGMLEHTNLSVSDPAKTAKMLADVFGWHIRWQGDAINGGHTIHVGTDHRYLALYTDPGKMAADSPNSYRTIGGLNHIGIVVDDFNATEDRVRAAGFAPHSHQEYEPGRRFYFYDHDGVEFEVVAYDT